MSLLITICKLSVWRNTRLSCGSTSANESHTSERLSTKKASLMTFTLAKLSAISESRIRLAFASNSAARVAESGLVRVQ